MNTLELKNLEVTAQNRSAGKNGAPSSRDFNDTMREILSDLATTVKYMNDEILPVLRALPETASEGLTGETLLVKSGASGIFKNVTENRSFTVAEMFSNVYALADQQTRKLDEIRSQVIKLTSLLSTTGNTDILKSVQNFSDQIRSLTSTIASVGQNQRTYEAKLSETKNVSLSIDDVSANGFNETEINWPTSFPDNRYTVLVSVEDETDNLVISGWNKLENGIGVRVKVFNPSGSDVSDAVLHIVGKYYGGEGEA